MSADTGRGARKVTTEFGKEVSEQLAKYGDDVARGVKETAEQAGKKARQEFSKEASEQLSKHGDDVADVVNAVDKTTDTAKDVARSDDVISKNIQASELTMTETVKNHANDVIKRGKYIGDKARPFVDKAGTDLIIQEIIDGGIPVKDKYLPNGWRWEVEGSFNGRSNGIWELVADLDTNQIVYFNFINR